MAIVWMLFNVELDTTHQMLLLHVNSAVLYVAIALEELLTIAPAVPLDWYYKMVIVNKIAPLFIMLTFT